MRKAMTKKKTAHRHEMDKKSLDAEISFQNKRFTEARIGQFCALIIGLTAIIGGVYAGVSGSDITGGIIGGGGVVGLVSAFIVGRRSKN